MMVAIPADDILKIGLDVFGTKAKVNEKEQVARFRSLFGTDPISVSQLIDETGESNPLTMLMTLNLYKEYRRTKPMSCTWHLSEKNHWRRKGVDNNKEASRLVQFQGELTFVTINVYQPFSSC